MKTSYEQAASYADFSAWRLLELEQMAVRVGHRDGAWIFKQALLLKVFLAFLEWLEKEGVKRREVEK